MTAVTWVGILICLSQSAMLSGLNLALFSLSKLELEVEAKKQNAQADRVLQLRKDSNFALVTILWGNVGVNVLLALLSNSVLTGVVAFLFSTVVITVFAEIIPQAYFSRHALKVASLLAPVLRVYQYALYPITRSTAWVLDQWLGEEGIRYFRERDLRRVIRLHMEAAESDIARMEGQGALNFLEVDDVPLEEEGEPIDSNSVLELPFKEGRPQFPKFEPSVDDPLLRKISLSGKSWTVITDQDGRPRQVLRTSDFLRDALFLHARFNPDRHWHKPIIVGEAGRKLGGLIPRFHIRSDREGEDVVENDVILLWTDTERRIITGPDILGRLLRNIAQRTGSSTSSPHD